MNTRILTLADAATVSPDGKLNLLGAGITLFNLPQVPARVGCIIVGQFEYTASEAGHLRTFKVHVLDADGQPVCPVIEGPLQLPPRAPNAPRVPLTTGFISQIAFDLTAHGDHVIEVTVDDNHMGSIPFAVIDPNVTAQQ